MSSRTTDEHGSIEGYTIEVYRKFGVGSPDDLDNSRYVFLQLIDRPGKVIDLGCGCGWFLKYLVDRSVHRLEPYGIDLSAEAIEEAKTKVFPECAGNFSVGDVETAELPGRFDFIIVNPLYVGCTFRQSYERYWEGLNDGGKLILMITNDTLGRMSEWADMWRFLKGRNLRWIQINPLTYGYATKNPVLEDRELKTSIKVKDLLNK